MPDQNHRDYYNRRLSSMKLELESFIPHYRDLSDFIRPRRGRFFLSDRNKGTKRHQSIINSRGGQAHRVAVSGMLNGNMSPTRPWFALETHNPDLMEFAQNKEWLFKVEILLRSILNSGNFYGMASNLLDELVLFGTGAMSHVDDFDDMARFYTHTAGSYYVSQNDKYIIDSFAREFEWPAHQIVKKFGIENVSVSVKNAVENSTNNTTHINNMDAWFPVVQFIEPNDNIRPNSPFADGKPFTSVYYEPGNQGEDRDKFLSTSGFEEFPVYVPRWTTTAEDIYGTDCPGMTALGDVKGLQIEEKRKAQGIDKMVNPPVTGPPSLRNVPINSLPGGATIYDAQGGTQQLTPLYTVNPQIQELRADIDAVENRINSAFFVDLFLAISTMEGIQPRNQLDLSQRNEERLLQLGPVLERIQTDFLNPLIDRLFNQALRAGTLPPPPDSLGGANLKVKYISTLAMAQRAVATQGIERLVAFAGKLSELGWPGALDKLNSEQAVDEYSSAIGTAPSLIVSDEEVAKKRALQQQQIQQQLALEQAGAAAKVAKDAASASLEDKNALTAMLGE